jgi:predicted hotdog family 3-hydroxylacyl-ACP dehydratase/3-hydroxymyristoyl/3-hydroxydecanoyl-(acyl carrier protein) dehydratase
VGPSQPTFTPRSSAVGSLRATAAVPPDLAHLGGHFPGHPIVPGFMQVAWALAEARMHLGASGGVAMFEALKFPSPLLPGLVCELELTQRGDVLRFTLGSDGELFSSGRIRLDDTLVGHAEHAEPATVDPLVPLRIPHAGSSRLLESVVRHDGPSMTALARLSPDGPLCDGNTEGSSCLAIELLGQAMAAHGGLSADSASRAAPRRGFLVSARRIVLRTRAFRPGERLWVRADHVRGEIGMIACRCALGNGDIPADEAEAQQRALALGTLGAFVEP